MARVVQIPKREAATPPAEAPIFSREQAHIVGAEKLASFRRGKAWGVAIGVASTLFASMVLLAFYAALDASSDASAITGAAVMNRADAVSAEMQSWMKE